MRRNTTAIIVGGGQAGLAMSRCLQDHAIDHVVVERGRVAERWRSERWDSLRLLTPNWMTRLPHWQYRGDDPDGFMTRPEVVSFLEQYAQSFSAPVLEHTAVTCVSRTGDRFLVETSAGQWQADNVVVATGGFAEPRVPGMAAGLDPGVHQVTPNRYRHPGELPDGGVLVVGASATGAQLAEEIHYSGRPVTLAVGRHTRLPRRYRGLDIHWWLDQAGVLDVPADRVSDLTAARREPSLQLVGDPRGRSLGLDRLAAAGVRLVGRLRRIDGTRVGFAHDLEQTTRAADERQSRLLDRIDAYISDVRLEREVGPRHRPEPIRPGRTPGRLNLQTEGINAVVWATGYRRRYPWLRLPVLDQQGELCHRGGLTPVTGLYVLGLPFMRRRNSTFIDGVGRDAEELAAHLAARIHQRSRA